MGNFKIFTENRDKMERVAVIMRGVSGSGKSTTAREMLKKYGGGDPQSHIFSTDDYFIQDTKRERIEAEKLASQNQGNFDYSFWDELEGETYRKNWSSDKLGGAHNWNFHRFKRAIDQWLTPVIVDNTNSTAREMRGYIDYAQKAGYRVVIQEPTSPWWQDHRHMLADKGKYGKELDAFANFLAGHHDGMSKKYGTRGNTHGVPSSVIRNMLQRWHADMTPEKVLNPERITN